MKKIILLVSMVLFSNVAIAGSCPMLGKKLEAKINTAKQLHEDGMKAHSSGDHSKSEELLKKALDLFKS
tara:strand:- start:257 stop:463 length:207 start_codon:yes stop_codon:yes gene_type:complete